MAGILATDRLHAWQFATINVTHKHSDLFAQVYTSEKPLSTHGSTKLETWHTQTLEIDTQSVHRHTCDKLLMCSSA